MLLIGTVRYPCMRGDTFHNRLVEQTAQVFRRAGFEVHTEHAMRLEDDRIDFADIFAKRGTRGVICEIETTPRNVLVNAAKAGAAGMPLWIVVPTRKVRSAVTKRLQHAGFKLGGKRIQVLLQAEVVKRLRNCFPPFSVASRSRENRKTKESPDLKIG